MDPIQLSKRECTAIAFQSLLFAIITTETNKIDIARMEDLLRDQITKCDGDINLQTFLYNALQYFKNL